MAILWEGNEPGVTAAWTYAQLFEEVCKLANALRHLGVRKGTPVCIYMPMIPEVSCSRRYLLAYVSELIGLSSRLQLPCWLVLDLEHRIQWCLLGSVLILSRIVSSMDVVTIS